MTRLPATILHLFLKFGALALWGILSIFDLYMLCPSKSKNGTVLDGKKVLKKCHLFVKVFRGSFFGVFLSQKLSEVGWSLPKKLTGGQLGF